MKLPIILFFLFVANITIAQTNCTTDTDGDGIADCRDLCPNTPTNARVDMKGCPRDTDGDGVADYKDKELITRQECLPVDSNGVGNCARLKLEAFEDSIIQNSKRVFNIKNAIKLEFYSNATKDSFEAYLKNYYSFLEDNKNYMIIIRCYPNSSETHSKFWPFYRNITSSIIYQKFNRDIFCFDNGKLNNNCFIEVYISNKENATCQMLGAPPHPNLR